MPPDVKLSFCGHILMDNSYRSKETAGEKTVRKSTTMQKNIWKEAYWYFDSHPIIAVWLMKEHTKKLYINCTL